MMPRETIEFPMVALIEGGVTTDGEQVLLQLMTVEDGPIHFGLRLADMESFVTFLLQMAASVKQPSPGEDRVRYQPIPISGISAGALADGMGCLGVTIGRTELMFQVPTAAISEVARTLLLVGADEHAQRPS
jgi:hypothetical protein